MEIALNLVWLAVCALTLRHWLSLQPVRGQSKLPASRGVLLLACALLLLFPVLSLTDDLHASYGAIENWDSSPHKVRRPDWSPAYIAHALAAGLDPAAVGTPALMHQPWLANDSPALPDCFLSEVHTNRPPPRVSSV